MATSSSDFVPFGIVKSIITSLFSQSLAALFVIRASFGGVKLNSSIA